MNVHESEKIAGILRDEGFEATAREIDADIIVFNTCCIRETAEAKIMGHIGQIKKIKKARPELKVAVCGCMSQQEGAAQLILDKFPFVDAGSRNSQSAFVKGSCRQSGQYFQKQIFQP